MSTAISNAFRVQARSDLSKGASKIVRSANHVPGIVYGDRKENVTIQVDIRDIEKGLHQTNFYTSIYDLAVNNISEKVLVKDVQYHPVTDRPIHIDFMRVSKGAKINVNVPIMFNNHDLAPGIKNGGVLNIILHTLEVTCSVDNIPDHLEIDLTGLEIGDTIHVNDIELGHNVIAAQPERDHTIASMVVPTAQTDAEIAADTANTSTPATK